MSASLFVGRLANPTARRTLRFKGAKLATPVFEAGPSGLAGGATP